MPKQKRPINRDYSVSYYVPDQHRRFSTGHDRLTYMQALDIKKAVLMHGIQGFKPSQIRQVDITRLNQSVECIQHEFRS